MSLTKASYSLINGAPANLLDFGAVADGTTDDTAAIEAALASGAFSVYAPAGVYAVASSIVVPAGVTIFGDGYAPYGNDGTIFRRIGASTAPIFSGGGWGWGLKNLSCQSSNAHPTGIVCVGGVNGEVLVTNACFENIYIYGNWDANTNIGLYIYGANTSSPVYYNRFVNMNIEHCGTGILLSTEANANLFSNTLTRSCRRHIWLESGALENVFTGNGFFGSGGDVPSIGAATCIFARNTTPNNVFIGFTSETSSGGKLFDTTGDTGCYYIGVANETTQSLPGSGTWLQAPPGPSTDKFISYSSTQQYLTRKGAVGSQELYEYLLTNNAYWSLLEFPYDKSVPFAAILKCKFTMFPPSAAGNPVVVDFVCSITNIQTTGNIVAEPLQTLKTTNAASWITDFRIVADNTGTLPVTLLVRTANNGGWGSSTAPLASIEYEFSYTQLNAATAFSPATVTGTVATAGQIAASTVVAS